MLCLMATKLFNHFKKLNFCISFSVIRRQLSVAFYGSDEFSLASLQALFYYHKIGKDSNNLITRLDVVTSVSYFGH